MEALTGFYNLSARYHKGEESKYVKKIIATHKYSTMSTEEAQKDLKQEVGVVEDYLDYKKLFNKTHDHHLF